MQQPPARALHRRALSDQFSREVVGKVAAPHAARKVSGPFRRSERSGETGQTGMANQIGPSSGRPVRDAPGAVGGAGAGAGTGTPGVKTAAGAGIGYSYRYPLRPVSSGIVISKVMRFFIRI